MNDSESITGNCDQVMIQVLEKLLAEDVNITARAVARLHPSLKAASSITRNVSRSALLAKYQARQEEFRHWRGRANKQSSINLAATLATRDLRIQELEAQVRTLTASHVALLRAVGELGGFAKWAQIYNDYSSIRNQLESLSHD